MGQSSVDNFIDDLLGEDELGSVIRAHLYIEKNINELVNLLVPRPKELKDISLDYSKKVSLICALGIDPEVKNCLTGIGKIRNNFAHRTSYELNQSDIKNLYKQLPKAEKELINTIYNSPKMKIHFHEFGDFNSMNPRNKFILISTVIKNLTERLITEIKNEL